MVIINSARFENIIVEMARSLHVSCGKGGTRVMGPKALWGHIFGGKSLTSKKNHLNTTPITIIGKILNARHKTGTGIGQHHFSN